MRILAIGDIHSCISELQECQKLVNWIDQISIDNNIDIQVFLGDQFHNHNIVDVRVQSFWLDYLNKARKSKVVMLCGNHDMAVSRDINTRHSLEPFKNLLNVTIVDKPIVISNILFTPYVYDKNKFVDYCKSANTLGVICHQDFTGMKYENGFPITDGVELKNIPQVWVRSGHIHSAQEAGKLKYIGSPRWRTASDVNQNKRVSIMDTNDNGAIISEADIDTSAVMQPMVLLKDAEESPVIEFKDNIRYIIDIFGNKDYINKRKMELKRDNIRIRTFILNDNKTNIKESEGIFNAFNKFFLGFKPPNNSDKERLLKLINDRIKF